MRVGLFVTCLGDTLFPSAGQAVVRLPDAHRRRAGARPHRGPDGRSLRTRRSSDGGTALHLGMHFMPKRNRIAEGMHGPRQLHVVIAA